MVAFRARGWELVASSVSARLAAALEQQAGRLVRIGEGRFTIELPLDEPLDRVLADLAADGASVVSLNPLRDSLEDYFVRQVASEAATSHDRGLDDLRASGGPR
jgi:hypothetical protein